MNITNQQYDAVIQQCKKIFVQKATDYGTAWRVLRIVSVVDQLFIKALRIRTIQDKKIQLVADDIASEFKAIVNYAVIGLIQLEIGDAKVEEIPVTQVEDWYEKQIQIAKNIMQNKNHDYGEAWREMSQESFADLILMKLMRIKQILFNDGKTIVSEGIDANFIDIINYAVFALILMHK
ncbi:MAG: DUF1599 domain-containing protein [Sphingobacteriales bacterium]|uniref:DUF1599 domain-containing protein n=1 Tax=Hydrotalea flava TaxID=714549 RepID=UPI00083177BA|nr:DUF1599 domain-containing protein [Hydrotalea flava]RTL56778.1 MAG: DUF1599 domain-containing protein [Sphingobacteriales bacterium]